MSTQFLALSQVSFITVGAEGVPGQRTFFLQAAQGDLLVSLVIEKQQVLALSLGISRLLEKLGGISGDALFPTDLDLRQPVRPLFRVSNLGLGYDPERDALVIVARALVMAEDEEYEEAPEVHFWAARAQMFALAERAAEVVAAGRPRCPLCDEPLTPGERHVCVRGNGRKRLDRLDE